MHNVTVRISNRDSLFVHMNSNWGEDGKVVIGNLLGW